MKSARARGRRTRLRLEGLAAGGAVQLPHLVVISTHHKTGTVLWRNILWQIGTVLRMRCGLGDWPELLPRLDDLDLVLDWHSRAQSQTRPLRGVHVVRDPRDMVVSGCGYHLESDEPWLLLPEPEYDGRSYQQALRDQPDLRARMHLELGRTSQTSLRELAAWDRADPRFAETRYETLVTDTELVEFTRLFTHLGFPRRARAALRRIARRNSLFSGRVKSRHILHGGVARWRGSFERGLGERFVELNPGLLQKLGYEPDDSWIAELPEHLPALDAP